MVEFFKLLLKYKIRCFVVIFIYLSIYLFSTLLSNIGNSVVPYILYPIASRYNSHMIERT